MLLGALLVKGVVPGHLLFTQDRPLVYAIFLALFVSNVFMLSFQLAGVRLFPRVLAVPLSVLSPVVIVLSLIGSYAIEGQAVGAAIFDMGVALALGIIGYFLKKADYPVAPIVLGLILGGMLEESFRRAVKLAGGSYLVFFTRPISVAFIVLALVSVAVPLLKRGRRT